MIPESGTAIGAVRTKVEAASAKVAKVAKIMLEIAYVANQGRYELDNGEFGDSNQIGLSYADDVDVGIECVWGVGRNEEEGRKRPVYI